MLWQFSYKDAVSERKELGIWMIYGFRSKKEYLRSNYFERKSDNFFWRKGEMKQGPECITKMHITLNEIIRCPSRSTPWVQSKSDPSLFSIPGDRPLLTASVWLLCPLIPIECGQWEAPADGRPGGGRACSVYSPGSHPARRLSDSSSRFSTAPVRWPLLKWQCSLGSVSVFSITSCQGG